MLGVIIFDSTQRLPIYWSPRISREFVDGVLDVVTADRSSQFAFVMGPPSLYRGSVQSSNNNTNNSQDTSFLSQSSNNNDGNSNHHNHTNNSNSNSNGTTNNDSSNNKVSHALLHSSLLSGVVESHHKMAQLNNTAAETGLIRPPHWPRLIRTGGVPLGRAAVAPTCPAVSRQVPAPAPNALTKQQINTSKALNEGCVALSTNSQHSWLHPSVAPCSTEPVAEWILAHEPHHQESQAELLAERVSNSQKRSTTGFAAPASASSAAVNNNLNNNTSAHEAHVPSMFYFPWRIFGDSLGIVYCIFAPGPTVATMKMANSFARSNANHDEKDDQHNSQNNKGALGKFSSSRGNSSNDLLLHQSTTTANQLTNQSFAGFFGPSSFSPNPPSVISASPNKKTTLNSNNNNTVQNSQLVLLENYIHEENMPAVKQSMANLLVLLCDSFKTTKSVEAPSSKMLISNLDQVHECVEICCPGNGTCMPLFDTAMARKLWKMRNDI